MRTTFGAALAGLLLAQLAACAPRARSWPPVWPDDFAAAARFRCLGDGRGGGELAACQTLVSGGFDGAR